MAEDADSATMNAPPGEHTGSGPLDIGRLGPRYHVMRGMASAVTLVAMLALGLAWDWSAAIWVAVIAAAIALHALWRSQKPGPIVESFLVDITAVMGGLFLLAPPTEVGIPPVVALTTAAALFLGDRRAVWVGAYATAGVTATLTWTHIVGANDWTPTESLVLVGISIVAFVPLMGWLLRQANIALSERHLLEETLRERESRYRLITESVSDAIVTTDESGTIVYTNPAVERIFGHTSKELRGADLDVLMPERFRAAHHRGMTDYVETGRRRLDWHELELTGLSRDGSELDLEVSFGEFLGPEGRRFIGTIRDVTERQQAAAALKESEARYRGLFEGVPVGVYRTSPSGEIVDANPTLAELLGHGEPSEVIGRMAQDFYVDPTDREAWQQQVETDETSSAHEIRLERADGTTIWVRDSGRDLRDSNGEVIGYEGTLEDVTERRQAEERLRAMLAAQRRRLLYEEALTACSHALLVGTDDRALEAALDALLSATGVSAVFVERNEEDPDLGLVTNLLYEVDTNGQPPDYEHWRRVPWAEMPGAYSRLSRGEPYAFGVRDLEGEERKFYDGSPTRSELDIPILVAGEWQGLIGFADFEQERPWKEDEIALLRTASQMIGAFWERQQAHQRLQELVHYKDEFVASVSHELRTPLTAVVGLSEELANVPPGSFSLEELGEFHRLIAQQSREVAYIVEDLLVAARVEIETVSIDTQPVDLDAEVAATIDGWPSEFGTAHHQPGGGKVAADPTRVRQIVRNLLTNAARYGGERVVVVTRSESGIGFMQVRDNGKGVDADDVERIFQPYERATQAGSARPGSVGLGLYVSRQLARLMGGDLNCRREDQETVFELSLPEI